MTGGLICRAYVMPRPLRVTGMLSQDLVASHATYHLPAIPHVTSSDLTGKRAASVLARRQLAKLFKALSTHFPLQFLAEICISM